VTATEQEFPAATQLPMEKSVPKCSDTLTFDGADASGIAMVPLPLEATATVPRFKAAEDASSPQVGKKKEDRSSKGRRLPRKSLRNGIV